MTPHTFWSSFSSHWKRCDAHFGWCHPETVRSEAVTYGFEQGFWGFIHIYHIYPHTGCVNSSVCTHNSISNRLICSFNDSSGWGVLFWILNYVYVPIIGSVIIVLVSWSPLSCWLPGDVRCWKSNLFCSKYHNVSDRNILLRSHKYETPPKWKHCFVWLCMYWIYNPNAPNIKHPL